MIIGILASIALPNYSKFQARAHNTSAINDTINVKMGATSYYAEWGHYPY